MINRHYSAEKQSNAYQYYYDLPLKLTTEESRGGNDELALNLAGHSVHALSVGVGADRRHATDNVALADNRHRAKHEALATLAQNSHTRAVGATRIK